MLNKQQLLCWFIVQILQFTKKQIKPFNPEPYQHVIVLVQIIHLFESIQCPLIFCFAPQIKQLTNISALVKTKEPDTKNQLKTNLTWRFPGNYCVCTNNPFVFNHTLSRGQTLSPDNKQKAIIFRYFLRLFIALNYLTCFIFNYLLEVR